MKILRYFTWFQYKETEVLDIDALNNTKRADRSVLFFNRVPKVGSQTFMELLRRLSMRNGFSFNRDRVQRVETIRLAPIEQVAKKFSVTFLIFTSTFINISLKNRSVYLYIIFNFCKM